MNPYFIAALFTISKAWNQPKCPSAEEWVKKTWVTPMGFPCDRLVKNPPAMQETWVPSLGWEDSPGEGKGYPLQYPGLENSMDCIPWGRKGLDTTEWLSLHIASSYMEYYNIYIYIYIHTHIYIYIHTHISMDKEDVLHICNIILCYYSAIKRAK